MAALNEHDTNSVEINIENKNTDKIQNEEVDFERNIPILPSDKSYHAFICYADKNKELAYTLIERLTRFGYKICHHEDFTPGMNITENINKCVMDSMKTIFILSHEAINSPWCRFEAELTFCKSMELGKKILIPLAIDKCKIPDNLKTLTRIEYYNDKVNWWKKLLDAINAADDSEMKTISSQSFEYNNHYSNLDLLVKLETDSHHCVAARVSRRYIPEELSKKGGIQIPHQEYEATKKELENHTVFKHRSCYYNSCLVIFILMSFVGCWFGGFFLMTSGYKKFCSQKSDMTECYTEFQIGVGLLFIPVFCLLIFLPCNIVRIKKEKDLNRNILPKINRRMMKHQVMVAVNSHFMFNVAVDHLRNLLETKRKQSNLLAPEEFSFNQSKDVKSECGNCEDRSIEIELEEDQSQSSTAGNRNRLYSESSSVDQIEKGNENNTQKNYEEEATDILLKYSAEYLLSYRRESLPISNSPRHTKQTICLCEYVESKEGLVPKAKIKNQTNDNEVTVV